MYSVVFVSFCLFTGDPCVTTTYDTIGQSQVTWDPAPRPVQTCSRGTPLPTWGPPQACSDLFTMYPRHLSASGQLAFDWDVFLLPPTNKVWVKVIFSQASVSHSIHRGAVHARGMHGRGVCVAGGMHGRRGSMHGRRDGHCSGRYASYWNAFLLSQIFLTYLIYPYQWTSIFDR